MLSILEILLLILCAQSASAGPLRRFSNTTTSDFNHQTGPAGGDTSTITFTTTKTIYPPHYTSSSTFQSAQSAVTTDSFVFASSTLQVTVSQGQSANPAVGASASSDSTTTTTIFSTSTIYTTATATLASTTSSDQRGHSGRTTSSLGTASQQVSSSTQHGSGISSKYSFPTTFPTFTLDTTSPGSSFSSSAVSAVTTLPPIISASPTSSPPAKSGTSTSVSQSTSSASSTPPQSSSSLNGTSQKASSTASTSSSLPASSSTLAGITIVPVNPGATTIFMTITTTDAGVTTTIAANTVTVTAQAGGGSRHPHHGGGHG